MNNTMDNKNDKSAQSSGLWKKKLIVILLTLILTGIVIIIVVVIQKRNVDSGGQSETANNTEVTTTEKETETAEKTTDEEIEVPYYNKETDEIDVAKYYEENADVHSVIDVKDSAFVMSEKEVKDTLKERDLAGQDIVSNYSMTGEYYDDTKVRDNEDKHPMYITVYRNSSGDIWSIQVVDGTITAFPISFNYESELTVDVMISETEEITGYDSESNKFYKIVPKETAMRMIIKDKINRELLDRLTKDEIDRLLH